MTMSDFLIKSLSKNRLGLRRYPACECAPRSAKGDVWRELPRNSGDTATKLSLVREVEEEAEEEDDAESSVPVTAVGVRRRALPRSMSSVRSTSSCSS